MRFPPHRVLAGIAAGVPFYGLASHVADSNQECALSHSFRTTSVHSPTSAIVTTARVGLGVVFLFEATQKLFGWWSGSPTGSGHPEPFLNWPYWWAGIFELVLGITVTTGLLTRASALLGAGTMAYAYLFEHMHILSPDMFNWRPMENGGAFAAVYCFAFLLLFTAPKGTLSLDSLIEKSGKAAIAYPQTTRSAPRSKSAFYPGRR
ncbi:hypothetical protein NBRGN_026_00570 [Nocardia brasiliensis NBRC 14402]|nr:hypothetical protein NBRGN_026_00570 [Nocardia brasiliensis NBRC 14402]